MEMITIRPYKLCDVQDFHTWACKKEVLYYSKLGRWLDENSTKPEIVTFFNEKIIPHPWYRAICLNDRAIGFVCVEPGTGQNHKGRGLVSYALGRDYWGRGIATSALRLAVAAAFQELPSLLRIEGFAPGTRPQRGCWRRWGLFVKEGYLRKYLIVKERGIDVILYSILSSDPIGNKSIA